MKERNNYVWSYVACRHILVMVFVGFVSLEFLFLWLVWFHFVSFHFVGFCFDLVQGFETKKDS